MMPSEYMHVIVNTSHARHNGAVVTAAVIPTPMKQLAEQTRILN